MPRISINPELRDSEWWDVVAARPDAPSAFGQLLAANAPAHLVVAEGPPLDSLLVWARGVPGWGDEDDPHPLLVEDD